MRNAILALVAIAGCGTEGNETAVQAVAGPGGVTVSFRAEGQLAVSWSGDPLAAQYRVLRSSGGGSLALVDSVGGGDAAPATSFIDTELAGGVSYCYAIQSVYGDGLTSAVGVQGCGTATGGTPSCQVVVSPLSQPTITVDITTTCTGAWTLNYRFFSSGLAMTNRRDGACGSPTHIEFLQSAATVNLQAFAWINTSSTRVDCTVTGP